MKVQSERERRAKKEKVRGADDYDDDDDDDSDSSEGAGTGRDEPHVQIPALHPGRVNKLPQVNLTRKGIASSQICGDA